MNSVQNYDEPALYATGFQRLVNHPQRWPVLLCGLILSAAVFSGPIDIADSPSGDLGSRLGKTPGLILKLSTALAAGLVGIWGFVCVPRARQLFLTPPGWLLSAIAVIFLVTSATSITSASIPIALVFIAYLLFMPTCLTVLGLRGTLAATLWGVLLFSLGALFLYIFVPRYGVFMEDFGDGVVFERLGGLSQPNHTGRMALIGLLITVYFFRISRAPRMLCLALIALFVLVGALAMSRTALLAGSVCLVILNLDLILTRAGIIVTCLGVLVGIAGLFGLAATGNEDALLKKLLSVLTKTGDVEEVTEVTGRTQIWERTIELVKGRPLQGYGMGANKVMLVDHLQSTHNIVLHPLLAAGIGAAGLTLVLLLWNLLNVFISPQLIIRSLSAYILISGLTEDTIYETFPAACTLLWMVCCFWPFVGSTVPEQSAELAS